MHPGTNFEQHTMEKFYFPVGDGHELYVETFGTPKGIPVLFLHGGPGYGFHEQDKRFFDPKRFFVILFDQRGSSRSKPAGKLENNTTQDLVDDINLLLHHFKIDKALLFGGSWGSSLAMIYAIKHPERVERLLLRGYFPATRLCADYSEQGHAAHFFPEAWARYEALVPPLERANMNAYYFKMLQSPDATIREKYSFEFVFYGGQLAFLNSSEEELTKNIKAMPNPAAKAKVQLYYSINNFFIPDNYIYDHAAILKEIPIQIVHGRYDLLCPPIYVYELRKKLKHIELYMVTAGHASSEPEIDEKLRELLDVIRGVA